MDMIDDETVQISGEAIVWVPGVLWDMHYGLTYSDVCL
jgi:hypothetical protein